MFLALLSEVSIFIKILKKKISKILCIFFLTCNIIPPGNPGHIKKSIFTVIYIARFILPRQYKSFFCRKATVNIYQPSALLVCVSSPVGCSMAGCWILLFPNIFKFIKLFTVKQKKIFISPYCCSYMQKSPWDYSLYLPDQRAAKDLFLPYGKNFVNFRHFW